jgi:ubiquinone/menaquinone biosynthesis C-methylase UbiE
MATSVVVPRTLSGEEVAQLDPYAFFAMLGKRVIHPGGRTAREQLIRRANFAPGLHILDVGCGVGTTAIEVANRFGVSVTALDIAPLMLERARRNVAGARLDDRVSLDYGDITDLHLSNDSFDRVIAEAVTMFVERSRAARELVRVCKPGGRVLATEFYWRKPPTPEARQLFLGEVCPGLQFDSIDDWAQLYTSAGLVDVQVETGPFDMMTPAGFLHDEGLANALQVMGHAVSRLCHMRKMAWLVPRIAQAVPYLGFILVSGSKPEPLSGSD